MTIDTVCNDNNKDQASWLFYAGRAVCWAIYRFVWRFRVYGHEHIPREGSVIIAPNHASYLDPPLVASAMERPLHVMAKQELFDVPVLGAFLRRVNVFPVKRGARDVGAFRSALKVLGSRRALILFPEGTRTKDGNFRKPLAGVGMLACLSQSPVVPVRVINSYRPNPFKRLIVVFGTPLYPPREYTRDTYQRFSEQVMEEIKKLSAPGERLS